MSTENQKLETEKQHHINLYENMYNYNDGCFYNPQHIQRVRVHGDSCTVYPTNLMFHAPQTFKSLETPNDFMQCVRLAKSFEPSQ